MNMADNSQVAVERGSPGAYLQQVGDAEAGGVVHKEQSAEGKDSACGDMRVRRLEDQPAVPQGAVN